jgi:predicted GTPase
MIDERILLLGRTGVGKSSLINGLLRRAAAAVGEWMPTTVRVDKFEAEFDGIRYTMIDTPGLCDDLPEAGNDDRYLAMIKAAAPRVDHAWFVTRLDFTRLSADEKRGIRMITQVFGPALWGRALIVFTFRDSVPPDRVDNALAARGELIRREIAAHTSPGIARCLRAVSVNSTDPGGLKIVRR